MIEKMKKLTFLVYHREYDEFLHRLQESKAAPSPRGSQKP